MFYNPAHAVQSAIYKQFKNKTGNVGTKNAIVTILIFIPGVELLLPIISNLT